MQTGNVQEEHVDVRLTVQELVTLTNALNEVCHGLDMEEFQTRMGVERTDAQALLNSLSRSLEQTRQLT